MRGAAFLIIANLALTACVSGGAPNRAGGAIAPTPDRPADPITERVVNFYVSTCLAYFGDYGALIRKVEESGAPEASRGGSIVGERVWLAHRDGDERILLVVADAMCAVMSDSAQFDDVLGYVSQAAAAVNGYCATHQTDDRQVDGRDIQTSYCVRDEGTNRMRFIGGHANGRPRGAAPGFDLALTANPMFGGAP